MTIDRNQVVDPVDGKYLLPSPPLPRARGELLVVDESARDGLAAARIARAFGERMSMQADGLELCLSEVRARLVALDGAIAEDSRAQLKGAVNGLVDVLGWCDAIQHELLRESRCASEGMEPIDLAELCRGVAAEQQTASQPISVQAIGHVTWWGARAALTQLLQRALRLVAARSGDADLRCVEVAAHEGMPTIRIWSRGEPVAQVDAALVDRFRAAAEHVRARVVPDALGPGGAGFVLRLPRA